MILADGCLLLGVRLRAILVHVLVPLHLVVFQDFLDRVEVPKVNQRILLVLPALHEDRRPDRDCDAEKTVPNGVEGEVHLACVRKPHHLVNEQRKSQDGWEEQQRDVVEHVDVVEGKALAIVALQQVDGLDVLLPPAAEAALHAEQQLHLELIQAFHQEIGVFGVVQRVVLEDHFHILQVLEIDLPLQVVHNASVFLAGVEAGELLALLLKEGRLDVLTVQVCLYLKLVGDFVKFFAGEPKRKINLDFFISWDLFVWGNVRENEIVFVLLEPEVDDLVPDQLRLVVSGLRLLRDDHVVRLNGLKDHIL